MFRTVRVPKDKVYADIFCPECDYTFKHIINFQLVDMNGVHFEQMCTTCQTLQQKNYNFSEWRLIIENSKPIIQKDYEQE